MSRIASALMFVFLVASFPLSAIASEDAGYFLIRYLPAKHWDDNISYENQPGLKEHHQYLRQQQVLGSLLMAGSVGGETGGLVLIRTGSLEEAQAIARQDPGVKTKIVNAVVTAWEVQLSSMRIVQALVIPPLEDPEQTFRLKRIDPESRINID